MRIAALVTVLLLVVAVGCSKKKKKSDDPAAAADPAAEKVKEIAKVAADPASPLTGIAECDRYIEKSEACLSVMPEKMQAGARLNLERMRKGWKKTASQKAQQQTGLALKCQQIYEAAKRTSGGYCPGVY